MLRNNGPGPQEPRFGAGLGPESAVQHRGGSDVDESGKAPTFDRGRRTAPEHAVRAAVSGPAGQRRLLGRNVFPRGSRL